MKGFIKMPLQYNYAFRKIHPKKEKAGDILYFSSSQQVLLEHQNQQWSY